MERQLLKLILEYKKMLVFLWVKFGDNSGFIWITGGWLIWSGQNFKGLFGYFQYICNKIKIKISLLKKQTNKGNVLSSILWKDVCAWEKD